MVTMIGALLLAAFFVVLLLIAAVDARTGRIPDTLNIFLAVCGGLIALQRGSIDVLAPVLGIGFLGAQWLLSRGRWIGSGDVLLMAGIGLALPSWRFVVLALAVAYVAGACVAALLLTMRRAHRSSRIPFGPFLAAGSVVAMLMQFFKT